MWEIEVSQALSRLATETQRHTETCNQKLQHMQQIYLQRNKPLYSREAQKKLKHRLKAVVYKFTLASFSLEQLWALWMHDRTTLIIHDIEDSLRYFEYRTQNHLLIASAFDSFLFQTAAFLDFYRHYLCWLLGVGFDGHMSTAKFNKYLERVPEPFQKKAQEVKDYFDNRVFNDSSPPGVIGYSNWGNILRSLRDKIAHMDLIKESFEGEPHEWGEHKSIWPTIQGMERQEFVQSMQNGMFDLLSGLSSKLFDLEWKSGPLREDLWPTT